MRYKILWIEDGALTEVSSFAGPVFTSMKYDLEVALDISDAVKKIRDTEYSAVIVDIRVPPGSDPEWVELYNRAGSIKNRARLGMQLLFSLLKPEIAEVKITNIPAWISADKFGVFTVEGEREVENDINYLGIGMKSYLQKKKNMSKTALLELIDSIINRSAGNSSQEGK